MLSVVTVNYKTKIYLERMLASLFQFHSMNAIEIFVVENNSGDDLSDLEKMYPTVTFIYSKKNLGFAGGCNLAIKQSRGDFVILINPDIIFIDNALVKMTDAMYKHPDIGIGGVALQNPNGTPQACTWRFPTPLDQCLVLLKIPHLFPHLAPVAKWRMDGFDFTKDQDVDQVMGAFFCIRRTVLDQIGLLDDGFFMWYEEVDFCKRTKDAGWRVRFFANIHAQHKKGSSFETMQTFKKQRLVRASVHRYLRKHFGLVVGAFFLILDPLFIIAAFLAALVKPI